MKAIRTLAVIGLALALSACGGNAAPSTTAARDEAAPAPAGASGGAAVAPPAIEPSAGDQTGSGNAQSAQPDQQGFARLVIKNAEVSLQVESVRDAEAGIRALAGKLGGYVVKVQTSGTDENMISQITFRVPAERFDDALAGAQGLAKKVLSRSISGDDVTEEYVDLESRLRNLEATRDRLQSFLDKATKVEDALSVNSSLSDVQGQIEQTRGRLQYLKQSAALSTVTVSLMPVPLTPIVDSDAWQPLGVARGALRNLIQLGQGLVNVLIVLLVWTPVWLLPLLLILWFRRRRGGRRGPAAGETA